MKRLFKHIKSLIAPQSRRRKTLTPPAGDLSRHHPLPGLAIVFISCLVVITLLTNGKNPGDPDTAQASIPPATTAPSPPALPAANETLGGAAGEQQHPGPEELIVRQITGTLRPGDTLDASLRRHNIPAMIRQLVMDTLASRLDFRKLRPGDTYTIGLDAADNLIRCTYQVSPYEIYQVTRQAADGKYTAERLAVVLEKRLELLEGEIDSSLFNAFTALHEEPALIYAFADIFASRIDFNTETRKGDRFTAVVEKYYKDDRFIGYGQIHFGRYRQRESGQTHTAYWYAAADGGVGGYFDDQGRELGSSFIRSPVPFGRVTSRFTLRRKHPILGTVRPHLGVDLAAPVGTPIMATADGKVEFAGRRGGFGKQIILKHGNGYRTYYGHLSRFKKGLRRGQFVRQKEVIGYVGSTGLSTGPHLDYRLKHNNTFKNPFAIKFRPKSVLTGSQLTAFRQAIDGINTLLARKGRIRQGILAAENITVDDGGKELFL